MHAKVKSRESGREFQMAIVRTSRPFSNFQTVKMGKMRRKKKPAETKTTPMEKVIKKIQDQLY